MAYVRKTHDECELWADYGYGKEAILVEDSYKEAEEQLKCYRENEPNARHWIRKIRVKN